MTTFAVLGLGEAGRTFATALAATGNVSGWDPVTAPDLPGVRLAADPADCVRNVDAVLSFAPAASSAEALAGVLTLVGPGTVYADFATAGPADKRALAATASAAGLRFADVAIMAPVRRGADATPLLLSGDAAADLGALLRAAGLQVEVLNGPPGTAAARKLLRSILVKGLTGVMVESLRAAEREGLLDWFSDHLVETLTGLTPATLAGFLDGTRKHSLRRIDEMEAAVAMAEAAGGEAAIAHAVAAVLRTVETQGIPAAGALDEPHGGPLSGRPASRSEGSPTEQEAPPKEAFALPAFLPPDDAQSEELPEVRRWRRAQYAVVDGFRPLELDLTVPRADHPVPVVLWIHGGAWRFGTNRDTRGPVPSLAIREGLLARGLAVAAVQYRLSAEAVFPAQLQDVAAAVRWLRRFADPLGLDAERVGVWGESAGGHLTAMLGLNLKDAALLGSEGVAVGRTDVQVAVPWYAPTDLLTLGAQSIDPSFPDHDAPDSPESLLVGGPVQEVPDRTRAASPINYVSDRAAPMLLVHGDGDIVVSPRQSEAFAAALQGAGANVELVMVPGANHVFDGVDPQPLVERSIAFLAERLDAERIRT